MNKRELRQARRERVMGEFLVAIVAAGLLERRLANDPSMLATYQLRRSDFENLRRNLEATYFVRLFAEFESGLRDVWKHTVRDTDPRTFELIDALGVRRGVDATVAREAQAARAYRNALVHEGSDDAVPVQLAHAARTFRRFFAYLPANW